MLRYALCAIAILALIASSAFALPIFKKPFMDKYGGNENIAAAAKKKGCNVCHVKGDGKTSRNTYGRVLAKEIEGDAGRRIKAADKIGAAAKAEEEAKVLAELMEAFKKAEAAKHIEGGTFGDRLKAGRLPVE